MVFIFSHEANKLLWVCVVIDVFYGRYEHRRRRCRRRDCPGQRMGFRDAFTAIRQFAHAKACFIVTGPTAGLTQGSIDFADRTAAACGALSIFLLVLATMLYLHEQRAESIHRIALRTPGNSCAISGGRMPMPVMAGS